MPKEDKDKAEGSEKKEEIKKIVKDTTESARRIVEQAKDVTVVFGRVSDFGEIVEPLIDDVVNEEDVEKHHGFWMGLQKTTSEVAGKIQLLVNDTGYPSTASGTVYAYTNSIEPVRHGYENEDRDGEYRAAIHRGPKDISGFGKPALCSDHKKKHIKGEDRLSETTNAILLLAPLEENSKLTIVVTDNYLGPSIMPMFEFQIEQDMRSDGKLLRQDRPGDPMKPVAWEDPRSLREHRDFIHLWHNQTIAKIASILDVEESEVSRRAHRLWAKYGDRTVSRKKKGQGPIAM